MNASLEQEYAEEAALSKKEGIKVQKQRTEDRVAWKEDRHMNVMGFILRTQGLDLQVFG